MWLKIKVLLWKSLQLRKRHPVRTLGDIIGPCLLFFFMSYIKFKSGNEANSESVTNESIPIPIPENYLYEHFMYKRFKSPGYYIYAPNTTEAAQIMENVASNLNIPMSNIGIANDETDLIKQFKGYYMANNISRENSSDEFDGFGIVFEEIKKLHSFKYKIRNTHNIWHTDKLFPLNEVPGPMESGDEYFQRGFLALQLMLDKSFMSLNMSEDDLANVTHYNFKIQSYPYIKFKQNSSIHLFLESYFPIITILSFLVMCMQTNKKIVEEKYSGIKELMKMMGLESWMMWTGWILHNVMTHAITILFITYICCFEIFSGKGPLLTYTNPIMLWILLLIYLIAGTFFSFVFCSIIHRPLIASIAGYLAWALSFFLPSNYIKPATSNVIKVLAMLLPNTAINFGIKAIISLESMGVGLKLSTLFSVKNSDDSFSIGFILFMLIFDCFLYGFITWYMDSVMPGKYGIAKPLNFLFKWSKNRAKSNVFKLNKKRDEYFENPPSGHEVGISIKNVYKKFGNFNAVNGVDLDLYKGQITALLGHNGAGKTTTMSIITGLFSPTSGSVEINGKDIFRNIDQFRKNLGLCPQHNLLFTYLTTLDHLIFFGMLKGLTLKKAKSDGLNLLKLLNILHKKKELVGNLSGGMKRKLSLAIALIGDPEVLILDEPTSGMDPESRRAMWDLLLSFRGTKTVLITTHFMEEADVLGDRIVIMDHGRVKCYGTSLFLKKLYGTGYNLTIVKGELLNVSQMMSKIQTIIPAAYVYSSEAAQTIINLPNDNIKKFPELFRMLESNKKEFDIKGMGISCTTMEEVFLRAEQNTLIEDTDSNDDDDLSNTLDDSYQLIVIKEFGCNVDIVTNIVEQYVSGCSVKANTPAKTIYNLPAREKNSFKSLYSALNLQKKNIQLTSFEITLPNMGDVYTIPLEENGHGDELNNSSQDNYSLALLPSYAKGKELLINQFKVLLNKKLIYSKRSLCITLIFGSLAILFGKLAMLSTYVLFKGSINNHGINLSLSTYMYSSTYYRSGDESSENLGPYFATVSQENNAIVRKLPSSSYIISDLLNMCAENIVNYRTNLMIAGDFNQTNSTFMYNNIAIHTPAIAVNLFSNALLRKISGNNESFILTVNEPLIIEQSITMCDRDDPLLLINSWLNTIALGFLFLIASFITLPLSERVSGIKHLQIMSKLSPVMYWATCFIWDYFCYIVFVILTLVVMCYDDSLHVFTSPYELFSLLMLLLVYGWSSIFYAYVYSFFNKTQLGSILVFILINYILGMFVNMFMVIVKIMALEKNKISLFNIWNIVKYILFIIPNFSFSSCISGFLKITWENNKCKICRSATMNEKCLVDSNQKSYFVFASDENKNGILEETLFLLFSSLFYMAIISLFDYKVFARLYQYCFNKIAGTDPGYKGDFIDPDVDKEIARVDAAKNNFSNDESSPIFLVDNLVKKFSCLFTGVRGISFGVSRGECFGLLGVNGAGKTTTFQMLTGDTFPSQGGAFILADKLYKLKSDINQYVSMIGYCPQFNAINEKLTGKETLRLMAILRGISPSDAGEQVDKWIKLLGLEEYKNKLSGNYSGGNKRKLNTAMALIGDPPIVFLDEPTSGVDPASRRNLWKLLAASQKAGQAIVLTSHSMDECEALCNRLAIMVDGVIKCVGNIQYLKNRYGQGFTIMVKLINRENIDIDEVKTNIEYKFVPDILLKDEHKGLLHYHVTNPNLPLSEIFGKMKRLKENYPAIEDYTIGDTTLEQVFIAFAKRQAMPNVL